MHKCALPLSGHPCKPGCDLAIGGAVTLDPADLVIAIGGSNAAPADQGEGIAVNRLSGDRSDRRAE